MKNSKAAVRIFMDPYLGSYIVTSISVSGNLKLETFITHTVIVSYCPFIMLTEYVVHVQADAGVL